MIILDSNIVIYAAKEDPQILSWIDNQLRAREQFFISMVSLVEVLGFGDVSDQEEARIEKLLETVLKVEVTEKLARTAVRIRRSSGLKTADSIIAATAVEYGIALASRDRDFRAVDELELIEL